MLGSTIGDALTLGRNEKDGFERLLEQNSPAQARKKYRIAEQRYGKFDQKAEKHQQQVFEYIKEGSRRAEAERLPLALEAKVAQFNAVFARLRSFKNLRNKIIWRLVEVGHKIPDPEGITGEDPVDVNPNELEGLGSFSDDIENWNHAIGSQIEQVMKIIENFDVGGGGLQIQADDMLKKMENFNEEMTPEDIGASMGVEIQDGPTTTSVDGSVDPAEDVDIDMGGDIDVGTAMSKMEAISQEINDESDD